MFADRQERPVRIAGVTVSAALAAGLAFAFQDGAPPLPREDFSRLPACDVVQIVDGTTLIVQMGQERRPISIGGVSVPEVGPARDSAIRFLRNLLKGEAVYVEVDEKPLERNTRERVPACVYRAPDGLFVNLELVRQGYGSVNPKPPPEHADLLRFYERKARRAEKGIWAPPSNTKTQITEPADPGGKAQRRGERSKRAGEQTVYVTRTGTKYHRADCPHLRKSKKPMALAEARERYQACSRCKPPE